MPYIDADKRPAFEFESEPPTTPGELNYAITSLVHRYIKIKGLNYATINEAIGVLDCAKMELYRAVAAPYEDVKRETHGPVSDLDVARLPAPVTEITRGPDGSVDVVTNIIKLLDERLPPAAAPASGRRKATSKPKDAPATTAGAPPEPPASEAPKTSSVRRPAQSIGKSPMEAEAPASTPVARPSTKAPPVPTGKKLDPETARVSDVWARAASGNGEDDDL